MSCILGSKTKDSTDNVFVDKQMIDIGQNGETRYVDALHKGWACNRTFVRYFPPPVPKLFPIGHKDQEFISLLDIWKETAQLYIDDMQFILKLSYHKFWSQVIYHKGIHDCLISYLVHAPRFFTGDSHCEFPEEAKHLHSQIYRLVFMVYLRMATHKESTECRLTPSVFGNLIYDNYMFDIPKILDLCAIYGCANKELLKKMVENIFQNQPSYVEDLKVAVNYINKALITIEDQLGLRQPTANSERTEKLENSKMVKSINNVSLENLLDVISYALDIFGTVYSFLEVYSAGCHLFYNSGFVSKLSLLYDSVVGIVLPELRSRMRIANANVGPIKCKLNISRTFMLKLFHHIMNICFLQPVIEQRQANSSEHFESYISLMSSLLSEKRFIVDYDKFHPFQDDIDLFIQAGIKHDSERVNYILDGWNLIKNEHGGNQPRNKDKINVDCTVNQPVHKFPVPSAVEPSSSLVGAKAASPFTGVQLSSLISQVKDLLPDLGDGFVQICLDYYDYDVEKVINAILENSLPTNLNELDRKMEKLEDVYPSECLNEDETLISQRKSIFDNDEFDVFRRNDIDLTKVHKGKWNNKKGVDSKDVKEVTLKLFEESINVELLNVYDDEYDDTYDEQSIAANESVTFDEMLERRPFEQPRVLGGRAKGPISPSSEESEDEAENVKQDHFIQNPAELREKTEQRRQEKLSRNSGHRNRDVKGGPKGQGQSENVVRNRSSKEKNKTYIGNHNRRAMADSKRSRGMFPG